MAYLADVSSPADVTPIIMSEHDSAPPTMSEAEEMMAEARRMMAGAKAIIRDEMDKQTLTSEGSKTFNDAIHGHIQLPRLCIKIIDTPHFQR